MPIPGNALGQMVTIGYAVKLLYVILELPQESRNVY